MKGPSGRRALWNRRGVNGVIVIATKRGHAGKSRHGVDVERGGRRGQRSDHVPHGLRALLWPCASQPQRRDAC